MTRRGQSIRNASLLDADIPGLRKRLHLGETSVNQEADRYGVGVETIRRAARGETFRHIRDYLPEAKIPGEGPEHATKEPVQPGLDEAALESQKRFQTQADQLHEQIDDPVDFFLEKRKSPPPEGEQK